MHISVWLCRFFPYTSSSRNSSSSSPLSFVLPVALQPILRQPIQFFAFDHYFHYFFRSSILNERRYLHRRQLLFLWNITSFNYSRISWFQLCAVNHLPIEQHFSIQKFFARTLSFKWCKWSENSVFYFLALLRSLRIGWSECLHSGINGSAFLVCFCSFFRCISLFSIDFVINLEQTPLLRGQITTFIFS